MPSTRKIEIVFAPLPEERNVENSAAMEFALRIRNEARGWPSVEICHLANWKKEQLVGSITLTSNDECDHEDFSNGVPVANNTTYIFLISCGSDGSVHRSVRKTTKWIKEQQNKIESEDKEKEQEERKNREKASQVKHTTGAVALLGHSVCKISAEQMEDEVFSSGRRLAKSLQSVISTPQSSFTVPTGPMPSFLLETQIELEPPEEKFDRWVKSWIEFHRSEDDNK